MELKAIQGMASRTNTSQRRYDRHQRSPSSLPQVERRRGEERRGEERRGEERVVSKQPEMHNVDGNTTGVSYIQHC